ncbi:MAG: hypothetical protein ACK4FL_03590, partial [Microgenomates group bacterium]
VYHKGRNNCFHHIKREFNKGKALCYFLSFRLPVFLKFLDKKYKYHLFKVFNLSLSIKRLINFSKKKIGKNKKNIIVLLLILDYIINTCGYYIYLLTIKFKKAIIKLERFYCLAVIKSVFKIK